VHPAVAPAAARSGPHHFPANTAVGYTGGNVPDPTYERAGRHRTGHAEAVEVWFDPAQVSYAELVQAFWRIHNPTTRNRQGFDFGSQYRSAIFYHGAGQQEAAIASRDAEQQSLRRQIVTQITPASAFYRAEEYHQRYLEKHGHPAAQPPSGKRAHGPARRGGYQSRTRATTAPRSVEGLSRSVIPVPPAPGKDRPEASRTRQANSMAAKHVRGADSPG
jgi:peptide-methionine (S)-S-oxide reductase